METEKKSARDPPVKIRYSKDMEMKESIDHKPGCFNQGNAFRILSSKMTRSWMQRRAVAM